ncbi:uncharacterized protein LOC110856052 [Folsomia candida]|uniref:uncharacterized protein LOC110856052 n=1 Tax=Folsomia candida TaxID=158441 RepID=UPI000B8FE736|nr:uncharacterized protein LOC110856052 [Folsomia candida]
MRPYPGKELSNERRIFNYRPSRARRVIENSFGIIAQRFSLLRSPIPATSQNVMNYVKACIALHNFLRTQDLSASNDAQYIPHGYADVGDENNGEWRQGEASLALRNINRMGSNNTKSAAKEMREILTNYFVNESSVPLQRTIVGLE